MKTISRARATKFRRVWRPVSLTKSIFQCRRFLHPRRSQKENGSFTFPSTSSTIPFFQPLPKSPYSLLLPPVSSDKIHLNSNLIRTFHIQPSYLGNFQKVLNDCKIVDFSALKRCSDQHLLQTFLIRKFGLVKLPV